MAILWKTRADYMAVVGFVLAKHTPYADDFGPLKGLPNKDAEATD